MTEQQRLGAGGAGRETSGTVEAQKWADWAFKILSVLVIPLVLWGVHLQVTNAVAQNEVNSLKDRVHQAESRIDQLTRQHNELVDAVQETSASMRELRVSVTFIRDILQEIRNGLNRH